MKHSKEITQPGWLVHPSADGLKSREERGVEVIDGGFYVVKNRGKEGNSGERERQDKSARQSE